MKLFLQVIVILGTIIGLFFLLGYLVTEQKSVSQIEVKAPVELCWKIYQDESRISEWMQGVKDIELIEGVGGAVGAKQKIVMNSTDQSSISASNAELVRTITQIKKPRLFSYDYTNPLMKGHSEITFTTRDSTTTIKSVDAFTADALWLRSVLFLMKSSINKKTQSQFDKLKEIIEYDYNNQLKEAAESLNETIEIGSELD